jgi:type III pantothenate kinase
MLLTFDVGNTNIVVGLFDGERLLDRWRFTTDRNRTADEIRLTARSLLAEAGKSPSQIDGLAIASVVPSINAALRTGLESLFPVETFWVEPQTSPIPLEVDEPWAVGADRIVDAYAGHVLYGGALLIIDFGTAITFDLVAGDGRFLGGAIAPEMRIAAQALFERAAQLFAVPLEAPKTVIGKTTASNIQAGVVLGSFDMVEGLIRRFRTEYSEPLRVLATGGKGEPFSRYVESIELYDPDLTLQGLRLCWEHRQHGELHEKP